MKSFLMTLIGIFIVTVLATTFLLGSSGSDTVQGQASRIGTKQVATLKTIAP